MLTGEMKEAIRLLKEIQYMGGYAVHEQSLTENLRIRVRDLLDRLCSEGLLGIVDKPDDDPLNFRYTLNCPLTDISLYSLLHATGGTMRIASDEKAIYDNYGIAGRKLGVVNYMICHLFSQISVAEIILPEDCAHDAEKK